MASPISIIYVRIPSDALPRPWLLRTITSHSVRDTAAGEVRPPSTPVEARPPSPPAEVRPPSLEVRPPDLEVSATADTEASVLPNWGEQVGDAEASGQLVADPTAVPHWAQPTMTFSHVATGMHPYWLAGVGALRPIAERLSANFDCSMSQDQLHRALEFMVVERRDLCTHLHRWLQDKSSWPDANPQSVLDELARLPSVAGEGLKCTTRPT